MDWTLKGTPPRLPTLFQDMGAPLYFVTFNTLFKRQLLANDSVHAAFRVYTTRSSGFSVAVGRYVLMPDHIHVFVRIGPEMTLSRWTSGLKQCLGKVLLQLDHKPTVASDAGLKSFWQPGFFDRLLRRDESYTRKWDYVWRNPVRAGLVTEPEDWPYQGEIEVIDRV